MYSAWSNFREVLAVSVEKAMVIPHDWRARQIRVR
jgi:hypothetical protein